MTVCLFCKIEAGEIPSSKVWENEKFYAFLDINPVKPGHVLLVPKRHEEYLFALDETFYSEIFKTAKYLSEPIRRATGAKKIGMAVEGFLVPHVHIHLIPLAKGGELDPCKAQKASPAELSKVAEKIKAELSR